MDGVYIIFRVFLSDILIERNDRDLFIPLTITKKDSIRDYLLNLDLSNKIYANPINLKAYHSDFIDLIEYGTIFSKFYDAKNIPSDQELINDLNIFLNFYKSVLYYYKDDTEVSVDEWVSVLKDETVINDKMFTILKILYSFDDHAGFTTDISKGMQELGLEPNRTYGPQFIGNGRRVQQKLKKRVVKNLNSRQDPNYITRFFYRHKINQREKFQLRDELVEALEKINLNRTDEYEVLDKFHMEDVRVEEDIMIEEGRVNSFYEYLLDQGYLFDKETIENYLLSLKVKPFAILTGNSGTGKTKLSQLYAKYISGIEESDLEDEEFSNSDGYITVRAKTNYSSWANKGWTLNSEDFKDFLPFEEISKKIDFTVDGIEGRGNISFLIQLYYESEVIKNYFNKLYQIDETSVVPLKIKCEDIKIFGTDSYLDNNEGIEIQQNSNKSAFNKRQWMLSKKFFDYLPLPFGFHHCNILVKGTESSARFRVMCKLTFENNKKLQNYLKKKEGKEVTLKIKPNSYNFDSFKSKMNCDKKVEDEGTGLHNKFNYKIIPVGANWTENRHIVGYYNVITNEYQDTPAYQLIEQANESSEPHFLILDEMNLSHVERYFADFLSAIESGEKIPLYGEEELTLPENLFIIGTVNVDETTYMFSPKVLDRANVIEFETYSASDYMNDNINLSSPSGNIEYLENPLAGNEIRSYGIDDLREIFSDVTIDDEPFWELLSYEINSFQNILSKSGFDFGFRVINEIIRFMAVAWEYEGKPPEFDNWTRYFDACIKQKMLPKLHGSEKIIGETLEELSKLCADSVVGTEDMVKYPESFKKLEEMKKILRKQRYVSFIN